MLLGAIGSGKTTFRQRLSNVDAAYAKTQTVYLADGVLDTPGEYLEHGRFNRALLLTSYDADLVLMFQSATASETKIPPGFATFFTKPVTTNTIATSIRRFRGLRGRFSCAKKSSDRISGPATKVGKKVA